MDKPGTTAVSRNLKIYLSGDMTLSGIARYLRQTSKKNTFNLDIIEPRFNTWFQDIVDHSSPIYSENPDFTIILLSPRILTDLPDVENRFDTFLNQLANWNRDSQFLVTNLSVDPISVPNRLTRSQELWRLCEGINQKLQVHSDKLPWLHIIDLKGFLLEHGVA